MHSAANEGRLENEHPARGTRRTPMKDIHRAGQSYSTRRSFVQLATASALLSGGAPGASWSQSLQANIQPLVDPPNFGGRLLLDEATRRSVAVDNGGHVRRLPIAVLKAQSVD